MEFLEMTLTLWSTQEYQIEVPKLHNMVQYQDMYQQDMYQQVKSHKA